MEGKNIQKENKMVYFWIRIFDFKIDEEMQNYSNNCDYFTTCGSKGTLLDEYYLKGTSEELNKENIKEIVTKKSGIKKFAKPRKKGGIYALIIPSNEHFYNRFTKTIDDYCFNPNCKKHIVGKEKDFPTISSYKYCSSKDIDENYYKKEKEINNENLENNKKKIRPYYYCCSYDCKYELEKKLWQFEGEFQEREDYHTNGGNFGYIYHIYNRKTNKHYIGQTIYMPFFRWQEHIKSGLKGDICDLVFEVITSVKVKSQHYLNNIEAWWINKFIEDYGRENVINITIPKLTMEDLVLEYEKIILEQEQVKLDF